MVMGEISPVLGAGRQALADDDCTYQAVVVSELDGFDPLDAFLTSEGRVRQRNLRDAFDLNDAESIPLLCRAYSRWLVDDMHIVVQGTNVYKSLHGLDGSESYHSFKARKRGNDIDSFRTDSRLKFVAQNVREFARNPMPGHRQKTTRVLYVTLTTDPRTCDYDLNRAWSGLSERWNLFMSNLRTGFHGKRMQSKDGKITTPDIPDSVSMVRSYEAHHKVYPTGISAHSGWPHIHAILCFEHTRFPIFDYHGKVRIDDKDRAKVVQAWGYGHVDVQGVREGGVEARVTDVVCYVSKNAAIPDYHDVGKWDDKTLRTKAIMWYTGARSYAVSRSLTDAVRLDTRLRISQSTILETDGPSYDLDASVWTFLGLVDLIDTDLSSDDWYMRYSEPPDWLDKVRNPHKKRCS